MNKRITIRDLQKISTEAIAALDGSTPITSGDTVVAILTPLKKPDIGALRKVLLHAERLARGRDRAADDAALRKAGIHVDETDWSFAAQRRSKRKPKAAK
jgi:hypothetical protein